MKIYKNTYILIFLLIAISSCQDSNVKENHLTQKKKLPVDLKFGKWKNLNDSLAVELELNQFDNWKELLETVERIVCNDSIPKITLKSKSETKTIYFRNPCLEDFAGIHFRARNIINIYNDTITKPGSKYSHLDSLESILRKDILNNGKDPELCDSLENLLIYVSYSNKNSFESFPRILDKLTGAYEKISDKRDIKIWLNETFPKPEFRTLDESSQEDILSK